MLGETVLFHGLSSWKAYFILSRPSVDITHIVVNAYFPLFPNP